MMFIVASTWTQNVHDVLKPRRRLTVRVQACRCGKLGSVRQVCTHDHAPRESGSDDRGMHGDSLQLRALRNCWSVMTYRARHFKACSPEKATRKLRG
jgi:hypothetical protein